MRLVKNFAPVVLRFLFVCCTTYTAQAGGPRWYTGPPYFTVAPGLPIAFYTPDVRYFTDPGTLGPSVTHAQADAMVAAAAAVWNIAPARLTLAQGGTLAEHLSAANAFFDGTALILPADAAPTNYRSMPVAIAYDTDGSLIDTLLGGGASSPSSCRQHGVVESVDGLDPDGTIHHALLILNGRCVGNAPEQLLQMQYQLTRAFGRVLGLAWSQLNDNVFTGTPTPTYAQELNWPLMHPIDIFCGPYTYQCMANPFTLREDDIAALAGLYPVTPANLIAGKILSATNAMGVHGEIDFPNGEGMDAVVIVLRRHPGIAAQEDAPIASIVTGMSHQQFTSSSITGTAAGPAQSQGRANANRGSFVLARLPVIGQFGWMSVNFTTEPINPLYTGDYAIGPYVGSPPTLSGTPPAWIDDVRPAGAWDGFTQVIADAPATCIPAGTGTESAPTPFDASGFVTGQFCTDAQPAWFSFTAKPGRTFTFEVTAWADSGVASTLKAQPILGAWRAADPIAGTPTLGAAPAPFNSIATGTTLLHLDSTATAQTVRLAAVDQRGLARPDFAYTARMLYADAVTPAQLGSTGGRITITGMGFRTGNRVMVNGVAATVISWSANTIIATAPTQAAAHMSATASADVTVLDAATGASTIAQAALSYTAPDVLTASTVVSPRFVAAGVPTSFSFAVTLTQNGTAPAGVPVTWTATPGLNLAFTTTSTDAIGTATTTYNTTGLAAGITATLTGCAWTSVCATTTVAAVAPTQWTLQVTSGAGQSTPATQKLAPVTLRVSDAAGHALQAAPVTVYQTVDSQQTACPVTGRCPAAAVLATSQTQLVSDAAGNVVVTPLEVSGIPSTVNIAAATGSLGFITLTLVKSP